MQSESGIAGRCGRAGSASEKGANASSSREGMETKLEEVESKPGILVGVCVGCSGVRSQPEMERLGNGLEVVALVSFKKIERGGGGRTFLCLALPIHKALPVAETL